MRRLWLTALLTAPALLVAAFATLSLDRPDVAAGPRPRRLPQSVEDSTPTLDEVDFVFFSRPPYSQQEQSVSVFYAMAALYLLSAIVMLVGLNLDAAEQKRRLARAIVPQELVPKRLCCCSVMMPQESVPCEITEQYYLDGRLLSLRSAEEVQKRKKRMNFWAYAWRNLHDFAEVLAREHLAISFFAKAIPTFTRVKRGALLILQVHLCMLTAAMVFNVREHEAPRGVYELTQCPGGKLWSSECMATLPLALLASAAFCPLFRFGVARQVRLTCFVSQSHPSTSPFPLGVRKFAGVAPKSFLESLLCMRNGFERHKARVAMSRTLVHRAVHLIWQTTQSSVKDLRFHGILTSWCIFVLGLGAIVGSAAYVLTLTVYLKDAVVFHWLMWSVVMFFACVIVLEPLLLLWTEVIWAAFAAALAQHWGFGSHALAATTKYKEVVRQVDDVIVSGLRNVASVRIQRWWVAVLDMYRAIHEQTAAAIKIQAITKKNNQKKKYVKERKWCLKVDVLDCADLQQTATLGQLMSPVIKLQCDVGNPNILQTRVSWETGNHASFNETFFVDIKESNSLYISAWSKTSVTVDEFIGRGFFEFSQMRERFGDLPGGKILNIPLQDIQVGETKKRGVNAGQTFGTVRVRVTFLDPLKEQCGIEGQEDWMLPRNRMKFALSKMGPGGRLKVGKMLGNLTPRVGSRAASRAGDAPEQLPGALPGSPEGQGGAAADRAPAEPSSPAPGSQIGSAPETQAFTDPVSEVTAAVRAAQEAPLESRSPPGFSLTPAGGSAQPAAAEGTKTELPPGAVPEDDNDMP